MRSSACGWLLGCLVLLLPARGSAAEVTIRSSDRGAVIEVDGKPFTEYLIKSGAKPILWPIIGPTGQPLTRAYPMEKGVAGEEQDHPHQRSFWFTHGSVNGVDFWSESGKNGTIEHREFLRLSSGPPAVIETRNDWLAPDGKRQLEDRRTLQFGATADQRWIDFKILLTATDGPVTFGDTKEGSFGVRVATSIRVDSKRGGRIVNSDGLENAAAWGRPATWVDYQGPVADEQVGIAILNHPSSFRFPTYWHVRTYGLFAANPFGLHDFTKTADGTHTLPAGEKLALRYKVIFHRGDDRQAKLAEAFAEYAKSNEP